MVAVEPFLLVQEPIARKAELTVLRPGARMAPATSTRTCWKTLLEKSGANGANARIIVAGRVRIYRSPLLAEIGDERTLPLSLRNG